MHRRTFSFRLAFAVLVLTAIARPSTGRAAAAKPLTWWIEARPWTCSAETGPLARQVQLACDATGRCAIASDERSADRRAVLICGDDGWMLEASDAKDQPLWTLALGATDDDARLRNAGVWIARSEGEGQVDLPLSTRAPPRHPPAPPSPSTALEKDRARDDPEAAHLSFSAMFHGSSPRSDSSDYGAAWGGRGLLAGSAPRATGPLILGIAGTAEYSAKTTVYSLVRGGLIVGLGASVGDFRLGLLVEGGPALLRVSSDGSISAVPQCASNPCMSSHRAASAVLEYAQASLFVEWSLPGPIHPILSPTMTRMFELGAQFPNQIPNEIVGLDVGFVWGQM